MTITLPSFLYLAVVSIIFFNIREALKIRFLTFASLVYVFYLSPYAGFALLCASLISWLAGMLAGWFFDRGYHREAKATAGFFIALAVASLAVFKYIPVLHAEDTYSVLSGLIMPIGYSFYMFQVISYLADIAGGKVKAEKSFPGLLLYLCWFPKFVSGPIERRNDFEQQVTIARNTVFWDPARWERIIGYILTGCVYKIVIADRLAIYVDTIFEHYDGFSTLWLIIGAVLYSFQIYCDFAGYSYAAIGISLIFGIELVQNFSMPYCSSNITEFWRRWHRSLSSWLRDYLYIPLGGNRRGTAMKILNTPIVFIVCGLWHGVGTGFLIWGLLHGIYSAADSILRDKNIQFLREGIAGRTATFLGVTFAWIFFRTATADKAIRYITVMLTAGPRFHSFVAEFNALGLNITELIVIVLLLSVMIIIESVSYKHQCEVPEILHGRHYMLRYPVIMFLVLVLILFGIYGPAYDSSKMIYMQF